jgi:hypothetical protein
VTTQPVFVVSCWLVITVTALVDPFRLVSAWPVTIFALVVIVHGSGAALRTAFAFEAQPSPTGLHLQLMRAVLVLLAGCSIAGAIASVVPSLAYRSESDDILYVYGVGGRFAPMLWGAIFSTSIGAIVVPSPRRIALAAGAGLVSWPLLLIQRELSRPPWGDLPEQNLVLVPWIVKLYVVAAFVASGLAVALAIGAVRLAAEPVRPLPPKASVVSRG